MAVAAAFGFDVAPDLLEPDAAAPSSVSIPTSPSMAPSTSPVLAAARALGIGAPETMPAAPVPPALPAPVVETPAVATMAEDAVETGTADAAAEGAPLEVATVIAKADPPDVSVAIPVALPDSEATAEKLEAALLSQLRSLEQTLEPPRPRVLQVEPPRAMHLAIRLTPELADPAGDQGRSPFAPDPVRQRTYVDLREPAPVPETAAVDDAPWRKYLAEPRAVASRPSAVRLPPPRPTASRPSPAAVLEEQRIAVDERRRGIRAMSAAAVVGLGLGLGLLLLSRESAPPPATAALEPAAPVVVAAADASPVPAAAHPVDRALETLLTDPPGFPVRPAGPAVIAEAGTPPEALVADAAAAPPPAAAPPLIRPPSSQTMRLARGVATYGPGAAGPLAYGPVAPSYDPVRQSLLRDDAEEAATEEAEPTPPAARAAAPAPRGDRATVSTFVNMRARPDNDAAVVAVLAQGLSVRVLGCDYWCEVEAGGKRGYVYKKFVGR